MAQEPKKLEESTKSLRRIQDFDVNSLVQAEKLGATAFYGAVDPAGRLINLFRLLPAGALDQFPDNELGVVQSISDALFSIFSEILEFDIDAGDNKQRQLALISKLTDQYQRVFSQIYPLIAYSTARTVDFNKLDEQGRAAVQGVRDQSKSILDSLDSEQKAVRQILEDVRKVAAEQGVSQQAFYFKEEADKHAAQAKLWRIWTIRVAGAVGVFSCASIFLHKWTWIAPTDPYSSIQFTTSKLLLFFILIFVLVLCSRNFLANRHNEIVNRHRQNSLLTYKALVDAGATPEARDIILNHAAASIYQLHDTGYTKGGDQGGPSSTSIVEMIPRALSANSKP